MHSETFQRARRCGRRRHARGRVWGRLRKRERREAHGRRSGRISGGGGDESDACRRHGERVGHAGAKA
eukprot:4741034-Pleurochrysis_carterae.AAC.2